MPSHAGDAILPAVDKEIRSADGTRLAVRVAGEGAPVLMVHGSAGGLDSWDPVAAFLTGEFEVWTYARRGYPPSGPCDGEKTFADDAADVRAVTDAAGGPVHLVGASYGATVALHALRSDPGRFRSAALFEPPLFSAGDELKPAVAEYRVLLRSGRLAAASRLFTEKAARAPEAMLGPVDAPEPGPGTERAAELVAEAAGCLHDLEAMAADAPGTGQWSSVSVPVLLMQGEQTWAPMPATMDALMAALPATASRVVLEGQSHFATHNAPELFARTLRGFFASVRTFRS